MARALPSPAGSALNKDREEPVLLLFVTMAFTQVGDRSHEFGYQVARVPFTTSPSRKFTCTSLSQLFLSVRF